MCDVYLYNLVPIIHIPIHVCCLATQNNHPIYFRSTVSKLSLKTTLIFKHRYLFPFNITAKKIIIEIRG